jgi:hypothetical protein
VEVAEVFGPLVVVALAGLAKAEIDIPDPLLSALEAAAGATLESCKGSESAPAKKKRKTA